MEDVALISLEFLWTFQISSSKNGWVIGQGILSYLISPSDYTVQIQSSSTWVWKKKLMPLKNFIRLSTHEKQYSWWLFNEFGLFLVIHFKVINCFKICILVPNWRGERRASRISAHPSEQKSWNIPPPFNAPHDLFTSVLYLDLHRPILEPFLGLNMA